MVERISFSPNVIFRVILCFTSIIITLGFFNSSWFSLLILISFIMCLYSGNLVTQNKNWILILLICLTCTLIKKYIYIPDINMGSNVFIGGDEKNDNIFKKMLPNEIYLELNNDFISKFPNSVSGPDKNLFDKSVTQLIFKNEETKAVKTINWKNRYAFSLGAFNDSKYNAYGNQKPEREKLPFFVKYSFPYEYNDSNAQFCWKGLAYLEKKKRIRIMHKNKKCIFIKENLSPIKNKFIIWLIDTGKTPSLEAQLIKPVEYKLKMIFLEIIKVLSGIAIIILSFKKIETNKTILFLFSFSFSFFLMVLYSPTIFNKFVLFEGGNDGLLYVHFAHLISDYLSMGNYEEAFRGGESAYDLMPFYRYVWIVNYLFFEESPWMFFFILTLFPLIIFSILKNLLNRNLAIFFLLCWFIFPLFEAFGFYHFYYVKLTLRGFAEPLSYLCFLSSLLLVLNIIDHKFKSLDHLEINYFFIGFLLCLALGLRANILPACLVLFLYLLYKNIRLKTFSNLLFLILGFSPISILPIHNYYFTHKFIPLTIAAYKDWNLGARPDDYIQLLLSFIKLDINFEIMHKIIAHVEGEIKLYEIWYHLAIIICIFYVFKKNINEKIKLLSYSSLSMIILIFFYHVGGRYSYLTWTLSLFVISTWIQSNLIPLFISKRTSDVS